MRALAVHQTDLSILLLQIAAILGLSRVMGLLFQALRLPQVVGEMAAGIMLGPAILGAFSPETFAFLFPDWSIGYLGNLSQLGVVFFLFLVGLELDPRLLMSQGRSAFAVGVTSIAGYTMRESLGVGILMNTRGLMELVILNVGRELGVISEKLFSMMVVMALVTTAMTAPLLQIIYPTRKRARAAKGPGFSILVPVSLPRSAVPLAELADLLTGRDSAERKIIGWYLRPQHDYDIIRSQLDERPADVYEPLKHLRDEAHRLHLPIETVSHPARDPGNDIVNFANSRNVDMILMGFHKPLFSQSILGETVHRVLSTSSSDVGVFVDRGFHGVRSVLVPFLGSSHDRLALELAGRIGRNARAKVTVLHVIEPGRRTTKLGVAETIDRTMTDPTQPEPVHFKIVEDASPVDAVIREAAGHDLLLIGVAEEWGLESGMFGFRRERIAAESPTSMLIVCRGRNHRSA